MSEQPVEEQTAIVEAQPVRALVSPEQAKHDWERFLQLKAALLTPDDYQVIQGKQYPRKSAFRKLSVAFGLSDRIVHEERTDKDDGTIMWRVTVEVAHPNGRVCAGVGICHSGERKGGNTSWAHLEHDVYATAHTRAKNRAIADMVAAGMVSAEEMETAGSEVAPQPPPAPAKSSTARLSVITKDDERDVRGKGGGFK